MSEIPFDHIQRLAAHADDPQMPGAVRLSAKVVQGWLDEDQPDAVDVLRGVMGVLSHLPSCAEDLLGDELYGKVAKVLGYERAEDEDEEDES